MSGLAINVEPEIIGKAGAGYNAPLIADINGVKGYLKKSRNCSTFDTFEYLICALGKMLNIDVADTYLMDDGSIFSKSIINDGEEFLTFSDLTKIITITDKEIREKQEFDKKMPAININQDTPRHIAQTEEEVDFVINLFIRIIKKLELSNQEKIIKKYIEMCFLDGLTGNKDRVSGNYGMVKKGNDYTFGGLFDNSTIAYKNVSDNLVQINNYFMDRELLIQHLIKKYPNYLSDVLNRDFIEVRSKLSELSSLVLGNEEREWFDSMVTDNILKKLGNEEKHYI